jgi:hypothetical protein
VPAGDPHRLRPQAEVGVSRRRTPNMMEAYGVTQIPPTYQRALGRCRRNGWKVVETLRTKGAYRLNYLTANGQVGTIKAR